MKHLTLSDRIRIEVLLEEGKSFSQIAAELGKCPTTISREVLRHRSVAHHDSQSYQ
jgi:IS30 family transposase